MFFKRNFTSFMRRRDGTVTVEASLLIGIMITLTGGAVEAGHAFWQWNTVQQSARIGARIASTIEPVASAIASVEDYETGNDPGDPLSAFSILCDGTSRSCATGAFDGTAFDRIIYGAGQDNQCQSTTRTQRGMCDVFEKIKPENVTINYENSGLGITGTSDKPIPVITVTVKDIPFNFLFLDLFTGQSFAKMSEVNVVVVAEDLGNGA